MVNEFASIGAETLHGRHGIGRHVCSNTVVMIVSKWVWVVLKRTVAVNSEFNNIEHVQM